MKKYTRISSLLLLLLSLFACTGTQNNKKVPNQSDSLSVKAEEIKFPFSDVLQLKSYYLSSSYSFDTIDVIVGYNYKTHALDYIDLQNKEISQVILKKEGPSAIIRLQGIFVQALDSVWLYDETDRAFLINRKGDVLKKVNMRECIGENEQILVTTNRAIATSHLHYDSNCDALSFLIKDISTSPVTFRVRKLFLSGKEKSVDYVLMPSVVEPDIDKGYATMNQPNVSFANGKIIYNYPIESHLYFIDTVTGERKTIDADSKFTENKAQKCEPDADYSVWERYGIENPHFYDIMFLSKYGLYARLHLGERDFDTTQSLDYLMNDRGLYLMIFDSDFNKMCEVELAKHRYGVFTGWGVIDDGIVLYNDNLLDTENNSEELRVDIIRPDK